MKTAVAFLGGVVGGYLLYRYYQKMKADAVVPSTDKLTDKVKEAATSVAKDAKEVVKQIFPPSITKDYNVNNTAIKPKTLIYSQQPAVKEPVTTDSFILWYKKAALIDQYEAKG